MANQARVDSAPSPTFIGDVDPVVQFGHDPDCGNTWCDQRAIPWVLRVWNCVTGEWDFLGDYPYEGQEGTAAYEAGGNTDGGITTTVEKILFSNDSIGTITSGLTTGRYSTVGYNSLSRGYALGGYTGSDTTLIDRMEFSSEAISSIVSGITQARQLGCGVEDGDSGYAWSGIVQPSTYVTTLDKLTFVTEVTSAITHSASKAMRGSGGFESSTYGYNVGGNNAGGYQSSIAALKFADETTADLAMTLTVNRGWPAAVSRKGVAGYTMGGYTGSAYSSSVDKFRFNSETVGIIVSTLSQSISGTVGVNSGIAGYRMSGTTGSRTSQVDKLMYTTEAIASLASTLVTARNDGADFENLS